MARPKRKDAAKPTFIEAARRSQIIEAAREVIRTNGFEKATISQIAEAINVSKGVILYHFGSKADLGKAVLEETLAGYGQYIVRELSEHTRALDKVLLFPVVCASYFEQHQDDFNLYIDALGSFGGFEEKRQYMAHANEIQRSFLMRIISLAKQEGAFKGVGARLLADNIQAFVDGINSQFCADPQDTRPLASAQLFQTMLRSIA